MQDNLRVAVLYGGKSVEHKVSCRSAATVCHQLQMLGHEVVPIAISREGRWSVHPYGNEVSDGLSGDFIPSQEVIVRPGTGLWLANGLHQLAVDIVFPVTHGTGGEDGRLQGLLDLAHVPYVGCGCAASANGMHKYVSKIFAKEMGIPTLPALVVDARRVAIITAEDDPYLLQLVEETVSRFGGHLIVKPEDGGSSIGITVVHPITCTSLLAALRETARYTDSILVEPWLEQRDELEVAVITDGESIEASDPGLLVDPKQDRHTILSYEQKYLSDACAYIQVPAPIDPSLGHTLSSQAIAMAKAIGVEGYARVDFFYDRCTQSHYFNEINTLPGMTAKSHFPILAESMGYGWHKMLSVLLAEGFTAFARRNGSETIAVE